MCKHWCFRKVEHLFFSSHINNIVNRPPCDTGPIQIGFKSVYFKKVISLNNNIISLSTSLYSYVSRSDSALCCWMFKIHFAYINMHTCIYGCKKWLVLSDKPCSAQKSHFRMVVTYWSKPYCGFPLMLVFPQCNVHNMLHHCTST